MIGAAYVSVKGDTHGKTTNPRSLCPPCVPDPGTNTASFGKILENRQEAERAGEQMQHVEAVIKMLDPSYKVAGSPSSAARQTHGSSAAHYTGKRRIQESAGRAQDGYRAE
jgi:hypothetical protein